MNRSPKMVTLVAAVARNRAIGLHGRMLWHLPAELRHFRATTLGHPVVMGRKTFQAIGRALPDRENIVVSGNPRFRAPGCLTARSLEEAVENATGAEVMVIGGGELYRLALPLAGRMVLSVIDCEPNADTWFPQWNEADWIIAGRQQVDADARNEYAFEIIEYRRV